MLLLQKRISVPAQQGPSEGHISPLVTRDSISSVRELLLRCVHSEKIPQNTQSSKI